MWLSRQSSPVGSIYGPTESQVGKLFGDGRVRMEHKANC